MDILSYALSKKFTEDTAIGLGAVKGSPATVKSYNYDADGNTIVTFEWTATDDTKRTSTVSVKRGIDGRGIVSAYFNEEGKLVIVVDGGEALDPITMPSASVEVSKVPENAVVQKADGIYVKTVDLDDYVEKEDGKSLVLDTDITQINSNKEAIEVLNGDNTVDGSVDKKITTAIGGLTKLEKEISLTVPTVEEARDNVLYLVPSETSGVYEQWMLIGGEVVSLGSTEVDLTNYVEKVEGKGLSTNDYTNDDKTLVETIEDKVDKEDGKGLSTNDFTDDDKDAVDSIENKVDRYATMPTPSAELSGVIAQYVGSGDMYQNGYFYICVQNDAGTWVWREKDVQKPADSSFKGTHDEWNDLSDEQKAQYETVIFTDDYGANSVEKYSTEEVKTNKAWIDGKPIYRKCIELTNLVTDSEIDVTYLNIDKLLKIGGFIESSSMEVVIGNYYTNGYSNCGAFYKKDNKHIRFQKDSNIGNTNNGCLILEYTKTTD